MNDSIKNRIEYLEGLEKAVMGKTPSDDYFFDKLGIKGFPNMENLPNIRFESISFPGHENLDFLKDMFEGMLLLRRVFEPLEIFYHYIYNNRILNLLITNILNKEENRYKPPFAPDVIYTGLVQLDKHTADCIIGVMSGSSSKRLENLRRAFLQGKKNFIMVMEEDDYDVEKGSKLLRSCKLKLDKDKNDASIFDFLQAGKNQKHIDEFKKKLGDLWPIIQVLLEFDEDVENGDWETKQYSFGDKSFRSMIELACDHIVEALFSIKTPLLPGEKTIFERIVGCSIYEKRYEEIKSKLEKKTDTLILTAEGGKKKKQPTSQIEESAGQEMKDVPERSRDTLEKRRGRHKDSWIKGRSQIKEEDIGALIQKNIWESLINSVENLKFKKGIVGITKEKQVKNFSAGLLYYALEEIGWARMFDESGIQSSFVRTMKFAGVARTSFEKNIRYIHEWYNLASEYKGHPNQFDECYSTCKEKDPHMAVLIFENVEAIGDIINRLRVKLQKILDENCKL